MNVITVEIITIIATIICGFIAKKIPWFNNNLIPLQNLLIGILSSFIYYFITNDFSIAITTSGIMAGGTYDILHNLKAIDWASITNSFKIRIL